MTGPDPTRPAPRKLAVFGGGLGSRFGERYMEPLTKEMGKHLFVDERPPAVRVASLGDLGGAIGASLLVAR